MAQIGPVAVHNMCHHMALCNSRKLWKDGSGGDGGKITYPPIRQPSPFSSQTWDSYKFGTVPRRPIAEQQPLREDKGNYISFSSKASQSAPFSLRLHQQREDRIVL